MPKIGKLVRRAGRENTVEHAIAQVGSTILILLMASPYGLGATAFALLLIAIMRVATNG